MIKPTLSSVLWKKFLDWIEKSTARTLLFSILEAILVICVVSILISPDRASKVMLWIVQAGDFLLIKIIAGWLLVKSRKKVFQFFLRIRRKNRQLLESIPIDELLHFLFSTGGFKFESATQKFRIHRKIYDRITTKLSALGVIAKSGKNNAWILNSELSRQEAADRIGSGSTLRIVKSGSAEVKSKEEIRSELQDLI